MQSVWASIYTLGDLVEPWQAEALLRMVCCLAIGGIIGAERELHGRPAGIRTHSLVCLGCCVIMLVSTHFARMYEHLGGDGVVRLDPARLAYGVITGIGFLGAGVIMKSGRSVHGLTTAASLWGVSALGLAVGVGMYVIASVGAGLMFVSLLVMRQLNQIVKAHHYRIVRIRHKSIDEIEKIQESLKSKDVAVLETRIDHRVSEGVLQVAYSLRFEGERSAMEVYKLFDDCGPYDRIEVD